MPSRVIAAPFILLAILFACLAFFFHRDFAFWIIPNFVVLAVIYSLHPQIDWMWYIRHPPEMDKRLELYVERLSPFYQGLDVAGKKKFLDRVSLYIIANEFILRGIEDNMTPPDDLKALFAVPLVELTFNEEENWRLKKFERLVLYPTSFPSPQNHDLHACEMETEDGVIIIALDLAKRWLDAPTKVFSLIHYQMGMAYLWSFPDKRSALKGKMDEQMLEQKTGMTAEELKQYLGLEKLDWEALALV